MIQHADKTNEELIAEYHATRDENGQNGDTEIRKEIVRKNLGLIGNILKKWKIPHEYWDDGIQEGALGIIQAIETFDPSRGKKFTTYASWKIIGRVTRVRAVSMRNARRFKGLRYEAYEPSLFGRDDSGDRAIRNETRAIVAKKLKMLDKRHRFVVVSRAKGRTMKQIGESLGISKERVRQLEMRAIEVMRGERYGTLTSYVGNWS